MGQKLTFGADETSCRRDQALSFPSPSTFCGARARGPRHISDRRRVTESSKPRTIAASKRDPHRSDWMSSGAAAGRSPSRPCPIATVGEDAEPWPPTRRPTRRGRVYLSQVVEERAQLLSSGERAATDRDLDVSICTRSNWAACTTVNWTAEGYYSEDAGDIDDDRSEASVALTQT